MKSIAEGPRIGKGNSRESRGIALYLEHAEEILASYRKGGIYTVPGSDRSYTVRYSRRGESCECQDYQHRGAPCKHIYAAAIAAAKSGVCDGCGRRVPKRNLHEVVEGDPRWLGELPLSHFEGEMLCDECFEGAA